MKTFEDDIKNGV